MTRAYVIANPKAGKGAAGAGLASALARAGVDATIAVTEHPGHGIELARLARGRHETLVVAAGGDGTVHEVVNGLLADGPSDDVPALGVIPLGSGCDYVKTVGIPSGLDDACAVLASDRPPVSVDAGRVEVSGGAPRWFANVADAGIGPVVVDRASRLPRALGPAMYLVAFWLTLPGYERLRMRVSWSAPGGEPAGEWEGEAMAIVAAIGRVFGGGMRVAPHADPSDGLFDVQIQHGSKADYVRGIPKVFRGTHVPHPRILEFRAARVDVEAHGGLVEADGEVVGRTPVGFEVAPGALRLKV